MLFLSLDPGGTKCEGCLCNEKGEILSYSKQCYEYLNTENMSSPNFFGIGRSQEVIFKCIEDLSKGIVKGSDIYVIAPGLRSIIKSSLEKLNIDYLEIYSLDEPYFILCAEGLTEGFIVISGTGAEACYKSPKRKIILDGLGPVLGDYGSGYSIGLKSIKAVAKSEWSKECETSMSEKINNIILGKPTNNQGWDLIKFFTRNPERSYIAKFAKITEQEAEKGDRVALCILREEAKALSDTLKYIYTYINSQNPDLPVVCGGSILTKSDLYFSLFKEEVQKTLPLSNIYKSKIPPCYGGCVYLATNILNLSYEEYQKTLYNNALKYHK